MYTKTQKYFIEQYKKSIISKLITLHCHHKDLYINNAINQLKIKGKKYNLSIYWGGGELCMNEYDPSDYVNISEDMAEILFENYYCLFDDISYEMEEDWKPDKFSIISEETKLNPQTRTTKQENKTMNKTETVINNTKIALNETKKTIVKMQKGKAVLSTVKTSLVNTPGIPDQVKAVLQMSGYGDLITGLLLNVVSSSITSNKTIISATKDANFAGSIEFSNQFTFFENLIEKAINGAVDKIENIITDDDTDKE